MQNYFELAMTPNQIGDLTALGLAHIGDAVFELLVRSWLCTRGVAKAGQLHKQTVRYVAAPAQAAFMARIQDLLSDEELTWFKRGRNSHVNGIPKNATHAEYAAATGLEALFGTLYLLGRRERINELFVAGMEADHAL